MRHLSDTLVWFGLIALVGAVVYFTPQVADYVSTMGLDHRHGSISSPETVFCEHSETSDVPR